MSANDNALCSSCSVAAAGCSARRRRLRTRSRGFARSPRCRIYDARPSGCRHFRCDTLEDHARGALTLAAAVARVDAAKARLSSVVGAMRDHKWLANDEPPAVAWMRLVGVMQSRSAEMSTGDRRRLGGLLIEAASAIRALKALAGPIEMG